MKVKPHRAPAFVPQLILHLTQNENFTCKLTDLPKSYQSQPYNLAAKLLDRGGITARIVVNNAKNIFSVVRFSITKQPTNNHHAIPTIPALQQSASKARATRR